MSKSLLVRAGLFLLDQADDVAFLRALAALERPKVGAPRVFR